MSTEQSDTPKRINILIEPTHTRVGEEILFPNNVAIILENGHSYDIDQVVDILEKIDGKKKKRIQPLRRMRHVRQAVSNALRESLDES